MRRLIIIMAILASVTITVNVGGADCITKAQGQEVTLAWDPYQFPEQIDGFRVYRSDTMGVYPFGAGNAFATITVPGQTEVGPFTFPVGDHYFVITAYKGAHESGPSNEVCLTVVPFINPPTGCSIR